MSRETITRLIDDIDGSDADQTVSFSINDRTFEIDLSQENYAELMTALQRYIGAARRTGTKSADSSNKRSRPDQGPVRAWAAANGYTLKAKGRIPKNVIDAYESDTAEASL